MRGQRVTAQKRNKIFLSFKHDRTPTQAAEICGGNRSTLNRFYTLIRRAIVRNKRKSVFVDEGPPGRGEKLQSIGALDFRSFDPDRRVKTDLGSVACRVASSDNELTDGVARRVLNFPSLGLDKLLKATPPVNVNGHQFFFVGADFRFPCQIPDGRSAFFKIINELGNIHAFDCRHGLTGSLFRVSACLAVSGEHALEDGPDVVVQLNVIGEFDFPIDAAKPLLEAIEGALHFLGRSITFHQEQLEAAGKLLLLVLSERLALLCAQEL